MSFPSRIGKASRLAPALVLLALSFPAFSQTVIGADEAVRLAKEGNMGLARSRITLESAKRQYDASWGGLIPSLSASATAGNRDFKAEGSSSSVQGTVNLAVSASSFTKLRQNKLSYEKALNEYQDAERSLELKIRKSFNTLLLLKENVKITEQSLKASKANWEKAEQRYNTGLAPELDVLSSRVNYENLKPDAEKVRQDYETSLGQFKLDLGLALETAVELSGSLDVSFDAASLDAVDWNAGSSARKSLELGVEAARAAKDASTAAAFAPSLSLSWQNSATYPFAAGQWTGTSYAGATLSWSLDCLNPLSTQRQAVKSSDEALRVSTSNAEEQKRKDALNLQSLRMKITRTASTLDASKLAIELAQRSYDLTREAYEKGTKDAMALDKAADNLEESKLNYLTQANNLLSSVIDLEYSLGLPFGSLGR